MLENYNKNVSELEKAYNKKLSELKNDHENEICNYESKLVNLETEIKSIRNRTTAFKAELDNQKEKQDRKNISKDIERLNLIHTEEVNSYRTLNESYKNKITNLQSLVKKLSQELKENDCQEYVLEKNKNNEKPILKKCLSENTKETNYILSTDELEKVQNDEKLLIEELETKKSKISSKTKPIIPKLQHNCFKTKTQLQSESDPMQVKSLYHSPRNNQSKTSFEFKILPSHIYYQFSEDNSKKVMENSASPISHKENSIFNSFTPFDSNNMISKDEQPQTERLHNNIRDSILRKGISSYKIDFSSNKKRKTCPPDIDNLIAVYDIKIDANEEIDKVTNIEQFKDSKNSEFFKDLFQEKQDIIEKLKILEGKLKNSENKNSQLLIDKGNLDKQLKEILSELSSNKVVWSNKVELKSENETALKNEIKYLISKLLKAKSTELKPKNLHSRNNSCSQISPSIPPNRINSNTKERKCHRNCVIEQLDEEMKSLSYCTSNSLIGCKSNKKLSLESPSVSKKNSILLKNNENHLLKIRKKMNGRLTNLI